MWSDGRRTLSIADLIADGSLAIGDGYRAKNEELAKYGLPFARVANINGGLRFDGADRFPVESLFRVGDKVSQPGDVAFTSKGTVGRFAFVQDDTEQFVYSPQLCYWRSLNWEAIQPRFLLYWMQGREFLSQVQGVKGQTDMADFVSLSDQRRMSITLPPPSEQRAIAHILGSLDDKIELNRQMNETLEAIARAIFKSWFVDFDPVRAKLALSGDRRSQAEGANGDPYPLDAATMALFPDRFVDSALGEVPEGWSVGALRDFVALNPENWSKDTRPNHINYVDLANTKWGRIESVTAYAQRDAPSRAQRILRPGDTIVGTVRPGNGSYAFITDDGLTGSTGFAVLRPQRIDYAEFVYLAVTATENIGALAHLADGAVYPAVRPEVVVAAQIIQPDGNVLSKFSEIVGLLLEKIAQCAHESHSLAALRDALLPKLISGELRVPEIAAKMEALTP